MPAPVPTYRTGELGLREEGDDGEKATPPAAPLEVAADAGDETAPCARETSGADDARSRLAAAEEGDEELSSTILQGIGEWDRGRFDGSRPAQGILRGIQRSDERERWTKLHVIW